MLGATLDYLILRGLAHCGNLATGDQLDSLAETATPGTFDDAQAKLRKLVERFEGHLPIEPGLRYLDMGCGSGELTLEFARLVGGQITGVDFLPRYIDAARARAKRSGMDSRVRFLCRDLRGWVPEEKYDVLLSFDAFEHVGDPAALLRKMADFVAPGGVAVLAFGPLFHSPFGDHMGDFFRLQIPWRGVVFSEKAVLRVRSECFRPADPVTDYREIAGGLNLMRYSEFLGYVGNAGWKFDYLAVNTFLRRFSALKFVSDVIARVPRVRDYFAHNVYAVLRRT
jgi:SAM-dependent methyltransferase